VTVACQIIVQSILELAVIKDYESAFDAVTLIRRFVG